MRLLGLDLETTGFDVKNDRAVELGICIWDVEGKRPLTTVGAYLIDEGIEAKLADPAVTEMLARVCGIKPEDIREFGMPAKDTFNWLENYMVKHRIDYVVAHNGNNYDRPLLMAELERHGVEAPFLRSVPWLDTLTDIPFATEPDSRKLKHLALDSGFINPFAHRAVFDVLTCLMVLSNYEPQKVIEYSKIPWVTVRAVVDYQDREKAKARRYSWEKLGDKTYPKCWVKRLKFNEVEKEIAEAGFPIRVLKEQTNA